MKKEQKIALVTGGSSGIGKQIALELANNNFEVIINYSNDTEKAVSTQSEIVSQGGTAHIIKSDISNESEVKAMFNQISLTFKKLDVLVNNAGIYIPDFIDELTEKNWDEVIDLNLKAKVFCTKYAIPILRKSLEPSIINIASRSATKPSEESLAYCCAAAGIVMLSKLSALELSKYNIRVNTVSPGLTRTPMTEVVDTEDDFNEYINKNPSKRLGTVYDIAHAVSFLTSSNSDFINGENINVSGGILLI